MRLNLKEYRNIPDKEKKELKFNNYYEKSRKGSIDEEEERG